MKRPVPVSLLCLCLCLALCGCSQELPEADAAPGAMLPESAASSEEQSQKREEALPEDFSLPYDASSTLDPVTCSDGAQQVVGALLYEGLYALNESLEPEPELCASAEYDAKRLTWTFRLREDVTFSDGSPLSASHVSAALRRAMDSRRYQARLNCVQSVRVSRGAVVVTLNRPNAGLPALLDIPIVKSGTENSLVPLGTGPYVLTEEDGGPCLTPNAGWREAGTLPCSRIPLVDCSGDDHVHYQFSTRAVQLITADLIGGSSFNVSGGVDVWDADTAVLLYLGFNLDREALSAAAARRALGLGVDREAVASAYLSGHAQASQFPVSPASPLYPKTLEEPYSSAAFAKAMADAGLDTGAEVPLTLLVNSEDPFKLAVANDLASDLSAFDWKLTVDPRPWEEFQAALAGGDYDLYFGEVRLTADWDLSALVGTGGALNFGGFSDPVLDEAMSAYAAAEEGRDRFLSSLCARLRWQSPILPLCFKRTSVLTQAGVAEGLAPTASNPFYDLGGITLHLAP